MNESLKHAEQRRHSQKNMDSTTQFIRNSKKRSLILQKNQHSGCLGLGWQKTAGKEQEGILWCDRNVLDLVGGVGYTGVCIYTNLWSNTYKIYEFHLYRL